MMPESESKKLKKGLGLTSKTIFDLADAELEAENERLDVQLKQLEETVKDAILDVLYNRASAEQDLDAYFPVQLSLLQKIHTKYELQKTATQQVQNITVDKQMDLDRALSFASPLQKEWGLYKLRMKLRMQCWKQGRGLKTWIQDTWMQLHSELEKTLITATHFAYGLEWFSELKERIPDKYHADVDTCVNVLQDIDYLRKLQAYAIGNSIRSYERLITVIAPNVQLQDMGFMRDVQKWLRSDDGYT
ncbi:MAG: hypothetical protein V1725_01630 [archaeon]